MKTFEQRAALDRFIKFITQRENVHAAKLGGAGSVTRKYVDPGMYGKILAEWRFCNVNREDDRVTEWIAENLRPEKDPRTLVMKLAVGRFINWPETLGHLIEGGAFAFTGDKRWGAEGWDSNAFLRVMDERMHMPGNKVYTGAYMIRAGTGADAKMPKHEYLVKRVFDPLWKLLADVAWPEFDRCSQYDELLSCVFGMGDFMRNQIITDMKYTKLLPYKGTPDWETFCLAGPGTNRGLNRLDGSPLKRVRKAPEANVQLIELRKRTVGRILNGTQPRDLANDWWVKTMTDLNNLSNCLCEFDKAERVRLGEGTPRSRYTPTKD